MVIGPGWGPWNLFRTAIETDTAAASAKDTNRRIATGKIATMVTATDIDRAGNSRTRQLGGRLQGLLPFAWLRIQVAAATSFQGTCRLLGGATTDRGNGH